MPKTAGHHWGRFDNADYDLVAAVTQVPDHIRSLFNASLHPRGIKELTAPRDLRVAFAVLHLIDSLEIGRAEERLGALRALRDEVSGSSAGALPRNTARVLVQIMKELLRARGGTGFDSSSWRTSSAPPPRGILDGYAGCSAATISWRCPRRGTSWPSMTTCTTPTPRDASRPRT